MSLNMRDNHAKAPPEAKRVVDFLRNKAQLKTRTGALNGKRVDYFKGKSAIKALRSPAYAKLGPKVPQVADDDAAQQLLHSLIPHTFFLRIQRGPTISSGVKAVQIVPQQLFAPDEHYVWLVDPNPIRQLALAVAMVAVVLAGVMFPLWPVKMRIGVWYLSVAVLGLIAAFFGLAIVRLVLWLVTKVVARPGIWLFPNLFADVGFVDSFIPTWGWDVPPPKKSKKSKDGVAAGAGGGDGDKRSKKGSSSKRRDAAAQAQAPARAPVEAGEGARITELVEGDEDEDDE
ncbi:translocation protein [Rhodotorula diobovata]|uniref:Translocation protein SEC62 n=1 Tax=Rhodotorula diobovata TaxID=5288 RepID=A0A5C5FUX0_9BASI|nr:translocation protein [Rhodotorula diobovata]